MKVVGNGRIGDELMFGIDSDLFRTEEVEYILGFKPALIELFEFLTGNLSGPAHLEDPK